MTSNRYQEEQTPAARIAAAIATLLGNDALATHHAKLRRLAEETAASDAPEEVLARQGGALRTLVELAVGGYFAPIAPLDEASIPAEDPAMDLGPRPPKPIDQWRLSQLPDDTTLARLVEAGSAAEASPEPSPSAAPSAPLRAAPPGVTTFLFFADSQPSRADDGRRWDNPRVQALNTLCGSLNGLDAMAWPVGYKLSCEGTSIGGIDAVFFGGDLCQCGGDYELDDQFWRSPQTYTGGWELRVVRSFFEKDFPPEYPQQTRLKFNERVYFGLGNHDVQTDYTPSVGWRRGSLDWSKPEDYWRFQMWNYVAQMHVGVSTGSPKYPVAAIDGNNSRYGDWERSSLCYRVDLGPVDVYQCHVYLGDDDYGRAANLEWLKDELALRGVDRPVVIVQHYEYTYRRVSPDWSQEQRAAALAILAPYNVVGLFVGHIHNPIDAIPQIISVPGRPEGFHEFRPGSCSDAKAFALVRITPETFDIMHGVVDGGIIKWTLGYSKPVRSPARSYFDAIRVADLGRLGTGDVVALQADDGRFVSRVFRNSRNAIEAAKPRIDPCCRFVLTSVGEKRVAMQADTSQYLTRVYYPRSNHNAIEAAKTSPDGHCIFATETTPNGQIALRADNGELLRRVDRGNTSPVETSTGGGRPSFETYKLQHTLVTGSLVALCADTGRFLCRINYIGADHVEAARDGIDMFSSFTVKVLPKGQIWLTGDTGKYLSLAYRNSILTLVVEKSTPDASCVFDLWVMSKSVVALRGANERYLRRVGQQGAILSTAVTPDSNDARFTLILL